MGVFVGWTATMPLLSSSLVANKIWFTHNSEYPLSVRKNGTTGAKRICKRVKFERSFLSGEKIAVVASTFELKGRNQSTHTPMVSWVENADESSFKICVDPANGEIIDTRLVVSYLAATFGNASCSINECAPEGRKVAPGWAILLLSPRKGKHPTRCRLWLKSDWRTPSL